MPAPKKTLLLVEDDSQLRLLLFTIFTQSGYRVRAAEDGLSALAQIRAAMPDIVLSDLYMPGMSGFELLSIIRRRFPAISVIAMSSAFSARRGPRRRRRRRLLPEGHQRPLPAPPGGRRRQPRATGFGPASEPVRPHLGPQRASAERLPRSRRHRLPRVPPHLRLRIWLGRCHRAHGPLRLVPGSYPLRHGPDARSRSRQGDSAPPRHSRGIAAAVCRRRRLTSTYLVAPTLCLLTADRWQQTADRSIRKTLASPARSRP